MSILILALLLLRVAVAVAADKKEEYSTRTSYQPTLGLGIRFQQHFFPNEADMGFVDGLPHLEQSYQRRQKNLKKFTAQITALNINATEYSIDSQGRVDRKVQLSHQYYVQKQKVFETDKEGLAFQKAGSHSNGDAVMEKLAQQKNEKRLPELDLIKKQQLRSHEITMSQPQKTHSPRDRLIIADSAVLAHAFNWRESAQMPIFEIEENEAHQIVEEMFSKIAKRHHIDNYLAFVSVFGEKGSKIRDIETFSKKFVYRDTKDNHPIKKGGLLLEKVMPVELSKLTTYTSMRKFFEDKVTVTPSYVKMPSMNLLIPQMQEITITNESQRDKVSIDFILSSTPEIVFKLTHNKQSFQVPDGVPLDLKPKQKISIVAMLVPETLGTIDAVIHISFNKKFVYMIPVHANVHPNRFQLEPLYFTHVNVGEVVEFPLKITNTLAKHLNANTRGTGHTDDRDLNMVEAYTTDPQLKVLWPNGFPVDQLDALDKDLSKYVRVPAGQTRHVLTVQFTTEEEVDCRVIVHLVTDSGHLLRLPVYFHVTSDFVRFSPPIVDFGAVAWRFNLLRVPVNVKMRRVPDIKRMFLTDVSFPLSDERLDFVIGKWADENWKQTAQTEAFLKAQNMKQTASVHDEVKALFADRKGPITLLEPNSEGVQVLTVLLDPNKVGDVDQTIEFSFEYQTHSSPALEKLTVSLPIIGFVSAKKTLMTGGRVVEYQFTPEQVYEPAIELRVSSLAVFNVPFWTGMCPIKKIFTNEVVSGLLMTPKDEPQTVVTKELQVYHPLFLKDFDHDSVQVWNQNPDILFRETKPHRKSTNVRMIDQYHDVSTMFELGKFMVRPEDLKMTAGSRYFFLLANQTILPQAIDIRDWSLLCQIEEEYSQARFEDCRSMTSPVDFGKVGLFSATKRRLHITNLSSMSITLVSLEKTVEELGVDIVFLEDSIYSDKKIEGYEPSMRKKIAANNDATQNFRRLKQTIYPKSTIVLEISVQATYNLLGGSAASVTNYGFIELKYTAMNLGTRKVTINTKFTLLPGQFGPSLNTVTFQPCLPGQIMRQMIPGASTFNIPLHVRSVTTSDLRVKPFITNSVVDPTSNVPNFIEVQFDPISSFIRGHIIRVRSKNLGEEQETMLHSQKVKELHLRSKEHSTKEHQKMSKLLRKNETDQNVTLHLMFNHTKYLSMDWEEYLAKHGGRLMTRHQLARWRRSKLRECVKGGKSAPVWVAGEWRDDISETVSAQIKVETDLVQDITINVTAFVQEPRLVQKLRLDFGTIHVGASSTLDFEVQNPFNESISVQLFLGRKSKTWNDYEQKITEKEKEIDQFMIEYAESHSIQIETDFQSREKLLARVPFMKTFCQNLDVLYPEGTGEANFIYEDVVLDDQTDFKVACPKLMFDYIFTHYDNQYKVNNLPPDWSTRKQQHWNIFSQSETFFKKKLIEVLEKNQGEQLSIQALTNPLEVIEAIKHGLIDFSKHPEALEITTQDDEDALQDILFATFARTQLWDPEGMERTLRHKPAKKGNQKSWAYNLLLKNVFSPAKQVIVEISRPLLHLSDFWKSQDKETILTKTNNIINWIFTCTYEAFRRSFTRKPKQTIVKIDEDFKFDPQLFSSEDSRRPSLFLSQFFAMTDRQLHQEVLHNNGTVAFQTNMQNFFIAPPFQGTPISVPARDQLKILESIVFEPKVLSTMPGEQMSMTVFLTTNRSEVYTVDVTGTTGSALLDISGINMQKFTSSGRQTGMAVKGNEKVFDKGCAFILDPRVEEKFEPVTAEERANCLSDAQVGTRLQSELFGAQSNITRVIKLTVDEEDLAPGGAIELAHTQRNCNFWHSLELAYVWYTSTNQQLAEYTQKQRLINYQTETAHYGGYTHLPADEKVALAKHFYVGKGLYTEFTWYLKVFNVGNLPFDVEEIGFEQPDNDRLSCHLNGFSLASCSGEVLLPQRETQQLIGIKFKADFSVSRFQTVLAIRNKRITQRFVVELQLTPQAVQVAQKYSHLAGGQFGMARTYLFSSLYWLIFLAALGLLVRRNLLFNFEDKPEKPATQKQTEAAKLTEQSVLQEVTPTSVIASYQMANEKFVGNQQLFLKESINLTQRKNCFTLEFLRKQLQSAQKSHRGHTATIEAPEKVAVVTEVVVQPLQVSKPEEKEKVEAVSVEEPKKVLLLPKKVVVVEQVPKKVVVEEKKPEPVVVVVTPVPEPPAKKVPEPVKLPPVPILKPLPKKLDLTPLKLALPPPPPIETETSESQIDTERTIDEPAPSVEKTKTKVSRMSKKEKKAQEKRLKEYQENLSNQLQSEKRRQREQDALDEIHRVEAEAVEAEVAKQKEVPQVVKKVAKTMLEVPKKQDRRNSTQMTKEYPDVDLLSGNSEILSARSVNEAPLAAIVMKKKQPLHVVVESRKKKPEPEPQELSEESNSPRQNQSNEKIEKLNKALLEHDDKKVQWTQKEKSAYQRKVVPQTSPPVPTSGKYIPKSAPVSAYKPVKKPKKVPTAAVQGQWRRATYDDQEEEEEENQEEEEEFQRQNMHAFIDEGETGDVEYEEEEEYAEEEEEEYGYEDREEYGYDKGYSQQSHYRRYEAPATNYGSGTRLHYAQPRLQPLSQSQYAARGRGQVTSAQNYYQQHYNNRKIATNPSGYPPQQPQRYLSSRETESSGVDEDLYAYPRKLRVNPNTAYATQQRQNPNAAWRQKASQEEQYAQQSYSSNLRPLTQGTTMQRVQQQPQRPAYFEQAKAQPGQPKGLRTQQFSFSAKRTAGYPPYKEEKYHDASGDEGVADYQGYPRKFAAQAPAPKKVTPVVESPYKQQPPVYAPVQRQQVWQQKVQQQQQQQVNRKPIVEQEQIILSPVVPSNAPVPGGDFIRAFKGIKSIFGNKQKGIGPVADEKEQEPKQEQSHSIFGDNYLMRNSRPLNYMQQKMPQEEEWGTEEETNYREPNTLTFGQAEKPNRPQYGFQEQEIPPSQLGFKQFDFQWKKLSPFNPNLMNKLPGGQPPQEEVTSLTRAASHTAQLPTQKNKNPFVELKSPSSALFRKLIGTSATHSSSPTRSRRSSGAHDEEESQSQSNYRLF